MRRRAHPRLRRGPGYPLQFLSSAFGGASGISASIPCAGRAAAAVRPWLDDTVLRRGRQNRIFFAVGILAEAAGDSIRALHPEGPGEPPEASADLWPDACVLAARTSASTRTESSMTAYRVSNSGRYRGSGRAIQRTIGK
jgi:hypothetical protein